MSLKQLFRILITSGILLWILAHVLEVTNQSPFNLYCFNISPILLFSGVAIWVVWYKKTRGHFPNPFEKYYDERQKNWGPFAGVKVLQKYIYEWIVVWFMAWIFITFSAITTFKDSEAFAYTKIYVEKDSTTQSFTGGVVGYGYYAGGSLTTGSENAADMTFRIIGKTKSSRAKIKLHKENGIWIVDAYNFY